MSIEHLSEHLKVIKDGWAKIMKEMKACNYRFINEYVVINDQSACNVQIGERL